MILSDFARKVNLDVLNLFYSIFIGIFTVMCNEKYEL